jgi:hypothetical protein
MTWRRTIFLVTGGVVEAALIVPSNVDLCAHSLW